MAAGYFIKDPSRDSMPNALFQDRASGQKPLKDSFGIPIQNQIVLKDRWSFRMILRGFCVKVALHKSRGSDY